MTVATKFPNQFNTFALDEGGRPRNAQVKPGEPAKLEVTGSRIPTLPEFLTVCAGQFGFVLNPGQAATMAVEIREYVALASTGANKPAAAAPAVAAVRGSSAPPAPPAPPARKL